MAHSRFAHDVEGLDNRFDSHTHIHIDENLQDELASTKLSKTVATKVSSEVYEGILAIAHCDGVTTSCAVRRLLMRALAEDAGNLNGIDSSGARRRR